MAAALAYYFVRAGRATAIDASCGDTCPAVERVGRIFVNGEEDAAEQLREMQARANVMPPASP
jgi:hypothetical protein